MADQINVALFGLGFMGRTHSNAYVKAPRFYNLPLEPVMHTACDPMGADKFAARWGWRNASLKWEDVVADPQIGLTDICTPNDAHRPVAVAALEAGKHVACEKPLAATLDEARIMAQAAAKAKKSKTAVWFSYRGCPALALAHRLVKEGKLGRIYHVRAAYLQSWAGPNTPLVWRFKGKTAGSGAHGDLNAHIIDACRFVTGQEITEICGAIEKTFIKERVIPQADAGNIKGGVMGKGPRKMGKVTVDDTVLFLARLSGGGVASFEATRLATGNQNANRIEINGEKGAIRWDFEDMNLLWYYNAQDDAQRAGWQRIMCTDGRNHPYAHAWWPDAHIIGYEHGIINLVANFLRKIAGQEPEVPIADFQDAYETQRVLHAAIESARHRCPIKMSEIK